MQDLINRFGINGYLLAAQIINFLIILFILKKYAFKPISDILEKRRRMIEETKLNAQKAEEALLQATKREKELLKKAQKEAQQLLNEAKYQADEILAKAHDKGEKQMEKLLQDAASQIEKDRAKAEHDLAVHVTDVAITMLKKSLPDLIGDEAKMRVLNKLKAVSKQQTNDKNI